jgi:hypothetical protein
VVADVDREHEDDQVGDGVGDDFHLLFPLHFTKGYLRRTSPA